MKINTSNGDVTPVSQSDYRHFVAYDYPSECIYMYRRGDVLRQQGILSFQYATRTQQGILVSTDSRHGQVGFNKNDIRTWISR